MAFFRPRGKKMFFAEVEVDARPVFVVTVADGANSVVSPWLAARSTRKSDAPGPPANSNNPIAVL
jgi:hypothetical protein